MFRSVLLATVLAVQLTESPRLTPRAIAADCPNSVVHEPLVIYEVTGGTFAGPTDRMLIVYSDGAARLVSATDGLVAQANVGPEGALGLAADLTRLGALKACDAIVMPLDVAMSTLTVLTPGSNSSAHTFSWWLSGGAPAALVDRLNGFEAETFPGL